MKTAARVLLIVLLAGASAAQEKTNTVFHLAGGQSVSGIVESSEMGGIKVTTRSGVKGYWMNELDDESRTRLATYDHTDDIRRKETTRRINEDGADENLLLALGSALGSGKDRLGGVGRGKGQTMISFLVADNLTEGLIEVGFWRDSWSLLKVAYDRSDVRGNVVILGGYMVTDKYGNTKPKQVGEVNLSRSDFVKINQRDFLPGNLEKFGNSWFSFDR